MHFSLLCDDVLRIILQYLDALDLTLNAALVRKSWYRITKDPELYHNLTARITETLSLKQLFAFIQFLHQKTGAQSVVREIALCTHYTPNDSTHLKQLYDSLPEISALRLGVEEYNIQPPLPHYVLPTIAKFKQLQTLVLARQYITDEQVISIVNALPLLKDFQLAECSRITEKCVFYSAPRGFQRLIISNCKYVIVHTSVLFRIANTASAMTHLQVQLHSSVKTEHINHLARSAPHLKVLHLTQWCISSASLSQLLRLLPLLMELDVTVDDKRSSPVGADLHHESLRVLSVRNATLSSIAIYLPMLEALRLCSVSVNGTVFLHLPRLLKAEVDPACFHKLKPYCAAIQHRLNTVSQAPG